MVGADRRDVDRAPSPMWPRPLLLPHERGQGAARPDGAKTVAARVRTAYADLRDS
ncbi:MAG: hypothetical protein J2P19_05185 [Pseudonocardia sp.]|nr:hypothetical protein [Pseudonocardia sp.]